MDKKYARAAYTGLKCGVVIAIINFILGLILLWQYSTPPVVSYMNNLTRTYRSLNGSTYNSTSYVLGQEIGQPPSEYYLIVILSLFMLAAIVIGFLAAGILTIRSAEKQKDTRNETFLMGVISGKAAFIPVFITMIITSLLTTSGPSMNTLSNMIPGFSAVMPLAIAGEVICCCLPVGILISAILAGLGALGYAYHMHMIERETDDVLGASEPPTPWKG
jgi:hypothetical protein